MTWRWINNDNVHFLVSYQTTFEGKMQEFSDGRTSAHNDSKCYYWEEYDLTPDESDAWQTLRWSFCK